MLHCPIFVFWLRPHKTRCLVSWSTSCKINFSKQHVMSSSFLPATPCCNSLINFQFTPAICYKLFGCLKANYRPLMRRHPYSPNVKLLCCIYFDPKITMSLVTRRSPKSQSSSLWDLNQEPFHLLVEMLLSTELFCLWDF